MSASEPFRIDRRQFVVASSAAALAASVTGSAARAESHFEGGAPFSLPPLPWKEDALAPVIGPETIAIHHGKHHKAYVDNLNKLIDEKKQYAGKSLAEVVKASAKESADAAVFNNAAQVWNHTFYWKSLKPDAAAPSGTLLERINASFGSLEACKKELADAAKTQFGSGWAWLVQDGEKLAVLKTGNAANPITDGKTPLLTLDVWEHAYYLDYQNRRPDYVSAVIDKLLNWPFAAENLG